MESSARNGYFNDKKCGIEIMRKNIIIFIFILTVIYVVNNANKQEQLKKDYFYNTDWHYDSSNYEHMQCEADAMRSMSANKNGVYYIEGVDY